MAQWRVIPDHPSYEASSDGRIRRIAPYLSTFVGRILKATVRDDGYAQVKLSEGNRPVLRYVHRLVASAFYGLPPSRRHTAAHRNGDRSDNRSENLRWATYRENEADKLIHGTSLRGRCRLTAEQLSNLYADYESGAKQVDLAVRYGFSQAHISRLLRSHIHAE